MRHCNGHSSMPDKQPRAFHSSSLDKEREEGSSFCAITFNNKMQGQALTQIEIHTECFCFIPLGQSSTGICKYFYLSICFQGHCTQSPLPNMSEKTAVNPSTVFFHSSVFHLHYASWLAMPAVSTNLLWLLTDLVRDCPLHYVRLWVLFCCLSACDRPCLLLIYVPSLNNLPAFCTWLHTIGLFTCCGLCLLDLSALLVFC